MGYRHAGNGFHLGDSQDSQIRLPLVEPKHRVMIGAVTVGNPCLACDLMEQAAQRAPIYGRSGVDPEPDDPTRPWSMTRRTQWVFRRRDSHRKKSMLHRLSFIGPMKASHEGPSHDIFIQGYGKGLGYLLGNFGAPINPEIIIDMYGQMPYARNIEEVFKNEIRYRNYESRPL